MRVARPVALSDAQRDQLRTVANSKTASVRYAQRAKMILLAGEGLQDKQIAATVGVRRHALVHQLDGRCRRHQRVDGGSNLA